jgi:hypothetical protein
LFPDGITFDKENRVVQTFRTNIFFELTSSLSTALSQTKSGDSILKNQISAGVTPKVEKSNFYKDLTSILEIDISTKIKEKKIKNENQ